MLEARNLTVRLGSRIILDAVDLALPRGEAVAVIGPNGAGKSTLLRALAGELVPSQGGIRLDGVPLSHLRPAELARKRAVLPQSIESGFPFTVAEIVQLGLPAGFGARRAEDLTRRSLLAVGLAGFGSQLAPRLSGGERQRVHLARALAQIWAADNPGYLLLDEPTASLDLEHQLLTLSVARAHAQSGGGVLAVLHDLNLAAMLADRIVALKAGRVSAEGTPAEVLTDPVLRELYRVPIRACVHPATPFVLPQTAWADARRDGQRLT